MICGALFTVSVKFCGVLEPLLLVAVKVSAYAPLLPAAGGPLSVPVPLPLSTNVTPPGNATPPRAIEGFGEPVVVTVNDDETHAENEAPAVLVIAGASFTVKVKL